MKQALTQRENEVLNLILEEKSNVLIAEELGISEKTVESHRKNIYLKTGSKTVVGLVKHVLQIDRRQENNI